MSIFNAIFGPLSAWSVKARKFARFREKLPFFSWPFYELCLLVKPQQLLYFLSITINIIFLFTVVRFNRKSNRWSIKWQFYSLCSNALNWYPCDIFQKSNFFSFPWWNATLLHSDAHWAGILTRTEWMRSVHYALFWSSSGSIFLFCFRHFPELFTWHDIFSSRISITFVYSHFQ